MSESETSHDRQVNDRNMFWKDVVRPTASSLESFFWKLLWFAVIVCILFSYNPFR